MEATRALRRTVRRKTGLSQCGWTPRLTLERQTPTKEMLARLAGGAAGTQARAQPPAAARKAPEGQAVRRCRTASSRRLMRGFASFTISSR
jgi:hypothetical protein